jgi:hypothetical protein
MLRSSPPAAASEPMPSGSRLVDRILAAAARIQDLLFITRDGKILEYGAAGHLQVMVC